MINKVIIFVNLIVNLQICLTKIIIAIMKFLVLIVVFSLMACSAKKSTYDNGYGKARPDKDFKFKLDGKKFNASDTSLINYKGIYLCKDFTPTKDNEITAIYFRFFPNNIIQEVVIKSNDTSTVVIDSIINSSINDSHIGNIGKYKILNGNEIFIEILRGRYGTSVEKGILQAEDNLFIKTVYTKRDDYLDLVAKNPKVVEKESSFLLGLFAAVDLLDYSIPAVKKRYQRVVPSQFSFYEFKLK